MGGSKAAWSDVGIYACVIKSAYIVHVIICRILIGYYSDNLDRLSSCFVDVFYNEISQVIQLHALNR